MILPFRRFYGKWYKLDTIHTIKKHIYSGTSPNGAKRKRILKLQGYKVIERCKYKPKGLLKSHRYICTLYKRKRH